MTEGYIKIYRSLLSWEWWGDANTLAVFIYLLLNANWQDGRFKGHLIKRGQLVITMARLAEETKLSVKQVRTAVNHLKTTGEIITQSMANRWTLITVEKYEFYQGEEIVKGRPRANQGQTEGQTKGKDIRIIRNKEYKNLSSSISPSIMDVIGDGDLDKILNRIDTKDHLAFMDKLAELPAEDVKSPYSYAVQVAKNMGVYEGGSK